MRDVNEVLEQVNKRLLDAPNVEHVSFRHLESRSFSVIFDVSVHAAGDPRSYILKISTTPRSCRNEFEMYEFLSKVGVRSLAPVFQSEEYNYILTVKEDLVPFDQYVKTRAGRSRKAECFYRLGLFFRDMERKTGGEARFDKAEFDDYVLPRLSALRVLSREERVAYSRSVREATARMSARPIRTCLVSDFSLGNVNIDRNGEIVLLDMGDASIANRYENICYVRLETLFGSLNQYTIIGGSPNLYFREFLRGYSIDRVESLQFALYRMKILVNMINFIDRQEPNSRGVLRDAISSLSDRFLISRYKAHAKNIFSELSRI